MAEKKGIHIHASVQDYGAYRQAQYNKLADELRKSLDMDRIYAMMGLKRTEGKEEGK